MRLLLVEDDEVLGEALKLALQEEGYVVDWVRDGLLGQRFAEVQEYSVMVLDVNLPGQSGFELTAQLRKTACPAKIMLLTARGDVEDRVVGLDHGADDYLIKPFDLPELLARLRALQRRSETPTVALRACGDIAVDLQRRCAVVAGREVSLTKTEFALLHYLFQHRNVALSRERLESAIYDVGQSISSNTLEVYVHHLRKKLGDTRIKTVRGFGYMLECES